MSRFSDRLNEARGDESIRSVAARAAKLGDVGESTIHPYFRDSHGKPSTGVVVGLAMALRIPTAELRDLAEVPAEGETWTPLKEARFMNSRQRQAVEELIRSMVVWRDPNDVR
ncbi:hypothetical protein CCUG60884_00256 [Mycobacteroides salmoniphilum]|uniref:HTH cro/C1-type domain-containing protein n=1 Tax=Mycobacteroides salmoniphilum TaxID=404941 RepID=A0A4R8SZP0_9MYCO|nr:hypothetical protein CCUG60884_00256 [Mycobacteroides salmoniphilum]